jgi:tetratricopeptide (TPR) repeat protein
MPELWCESGAYIGRHPGATKDIVMQTPLWRGGSAAGTPQVEGKHESEEAILDTMLASMARGALPAEAWERLHSAAQDEHRLSELAFGFESVSQGKRMKTLPPPVAAEFFFHAAQFFGDVFSDDIGAVTYLERALALAPTHSASFEKIEHILRKTEQPKKLSEVYVTVAQHRPRSEQAPLLRRAAEVLSKVDGEEGKVIELLQQAVRLDPADASARSRLDALYMSANRLRDVARLNEQALTAEPPPDLATRKKLLSRIVEVYADKLNEPERALPHVEHLLAMDPMHVEARKVAQRLVGLKGLAARAAAALATACEQFGTPQETARYLTIELENTRGAKRVAPLVKLGKLKRDRLGDPTGAFEVFEQALGIDPTDDALRACYVAVGDELGSWAETAKTLGRALATVTDPAIRAKLSAQLGAALQKRGDPERATLVLSGVLAAPEAPIEAVLAAARTLRMIHEDEKDPQALCDVLEWIVELEPDNEERLAADERLAEVATDLQDTRRAIAAYERLLSTVARARALAALAPLYEASGEPDKRARLLEEQAKDATDPAQERELMMLAAALRANEGNDPAAVVSACRAIVGRFGPAGDVLTLLASALETQQEWADLAGVVAQKAALSTGPERAQEMARVGALRMRLRETRGAIDAFSNALTTDPDQPTARAVLEGLVAEVGGDHRLAAACALEPVYRRDGSSERLSEVLELRASLSPEVDQRLAALREAAATADADGVIDIVGRALAEAVRHDRSLDEWLEWLEKIGERAVDPRQVAAMLGNAIGERTVTGAALSTVAKRAASAYATCGEISSAIALYERVLAFDENDDGACAALEGIYAQAGQWDDLCRLLERTLLRLVGEDARRKRVALLEITSAHGNEAVARLQCELLLADPGLSAEHLDAVEDAAHALGDEELAQAVLERRAKMTGSPLDLPKVDSGDRESCGEEQRVQPWLLHALALHQRALEGDSSPDDALAATVRLALAIGDPEHALGALRVRRARVDGAGRLQVDVEIAHVLVSRTTRPAEALSILGSVLTEAPNHAAAQALTAQLLRHRETRADAVRVLEQACDRADDVVARVQILECLLNTPGSPTDAKARTGWFGRLCDLERERPDPEAALATAIRAVRELPDVSALWDRAEDLARLLARPDEVAALYREVLIRPLTPEQVLSIGQRAIQFHDEWFEDPAATLRILQRVLEREPSAEWAFNRLKLRLDAMERWDELFALYDRALDRTAGERRVSLLEEAALTAKDFADRPDHAIRYLEELVYRKHGDPNLVSSLERLYDRQGRHRELVALLTARLPSLTKGDRQRARARIGALSLDELGDFAGALEIIEPTLQSGQWEEDASPEVRKLLERILAAAPRATDPSLTQASIRQRAAAWLRGHYVRAGADSDLARIVLVQLEAAPSAEERLRCHLQLAELHEKLGDEPAALHHIGLAATLDPGDDAKRAKLMKLGGSTKRFETLADFLEAAAAAAGKPALSVALTMQAAAVRADRMQDANGAIALLTAAIGRRGVSSDDVVAVGRKLESLLEGSGRPEEQLDVIERVAAAESDAASRRNSLGKAGRLASRLGMNTRAINLWQTRLADDEKDAEALDALVELFALEGDSAKLAEALTQRARVTTSDALRRGDRVRVAQLLGDVLGRPDDAIAAWSEVEREFGQTADTHLALGTLLRSTQRWQELVALLERASERTSDAEGRAELLRQIGDVQYRALGDRAGAAATFARALHASPRSAGARAGLLLLASDDAHRGPAIEVLLGSMRACTDWRGILELTEHRLRAATADRDRLAILIEATEIAEAQTADARLAFDLMRKAFTLAPWDQRVQSEMARLAEAVGAWRALVDSYQQAIDGSASGDAWLVAQLRAWAGGVLERRLDDSSGALDAYVQVVADTSDMDAACAAVRVAAQLSKWRVAAKVVVDLAETHGVPSLELFEAYEQAASVSGFWDEAVQALEESVSARGSRGPAARDIEARIAEWHRDRRGDPDAAHAALQRALAHDDTNASLLTALAEIQRRNRKGPLVHTLLRLSQATGGDLALLREAAEVARDALGDRALERSTLTALLEIARARCAANADARTVASAEWAIEGLARLHEQEGDALALVNVLAEGDTLPFEPAVHHSLRRRAARVALERLGDHARAITLYLSIFDDDPHDAEAVDRLLSTYAARGYTRDLLHLRERQIDAATDAAGRIALRLEAARLLVQLGEPGRASEVLRESLEEEAGHLETVDVLATVLRENARTRELCDLLEEQALFAEAGGDESRAADHWFRAATIAEQASEAETYHTRVVELEARAPSLDALARLATERGDHRAAAQWLDRLLDVIGTDQRAETLIRMCDALIAGGETSSAIERLEVELDAAPTAEPLRARLSALYREQGGWAQLARLVTAGAAHATDRATRMAHLLEAASLLSQRCGEPALAVPILEQASALTPGDDAVRIKLAQAFAGAERFGDARSILRSVIAAYGRRRPKDRASVHWQLARLELAAGDRTAALAELETATSIDPESQEILRTLAETARDVGRMDAAEKAYRALLDGLRRRGEVGEAQCMPCSEVLLELHSLAEQQGDAVRAKEIMESALDAAAKEDSERERLHGAGPTRRDEETLRAVG